MSGKILVVDDEHEIADLVELYLHNEDYEVFKFYSALVARLNALNDKRPHDTLHPIYDRCFYEDGIRHYYEMPDTVQGLLGAIKENCNYGKCKMGNIRRRLGGVPQKV